MAGVTQKPICFKIDKHLLNRIDIEVFRTGRSRNCLLNMALEYYLNYLQTRREWRSHFDNKEVQDKIMEAFKTQQFLVAPLL